MVLNKHMIIYVRSDKIHGYIVVHNSDLKGGNMEKRKKVGSLPKLNRTTVLYLQRSIEEYQLEAQKLDQKRLQLLCEAAFLRARLRLQSGQG